MGGIQRDMLLYTATRSNLIAAIADHAGRRF